TSDFICAPSSSGELPTASTPEARNWSLTSGVFRNRTASLFSRAITAAGVRAGARKAVLGVDSKPGRVAASGGTPGTSGEGSGVVIARAFSLPDLIWGSDEEGVINDI